MGRPGVWIEGEECEPEAWVRIAGARSEDRGIRELLELMRKEQDEREVYCLTSHKRLCLLDRDDWKGPWL